MYGYFCNYNRPTMYIVYGIPNCDTLKKAIAWLQKNKVPYELHDYKKKSITPKKMKTWSKQIGWETLLNKKGTTWRDLDSAAQTAITNEATAIAFLIQNTSAIKRPVIEKESTVIAVGFDEGTYEKLFKK